MIKPNKFLDLDSCIINISGEITKILLQRNSIKYNDLYEILKNTKHDDLKIDVVGNVILLKKRKNRTEKK